MKNHIVESHASLCGLKFWTFNLGDNRPTLELVFGVEGRSTTILTLFPELVSCHASLFGLKFWTLNLRDNHPTLEPIFGVEGRSIHLIIL